MKVLDFGIAKTRSRRSTRSAERADSSCARSTGRGRGGRHAALHGARADARRAVDGAPISSRGASSPTSCSRASLPWGQKLDAIQLVAAVISNDPIDPRDEEPRRPHVARGGGPAHALEGARRALPVDARRRRRARRGRGRDGADAGRACDGVASRRTRGTRAARRDDDTDGAAIDTRVALAEAAIARSRSRSSHCAAASRPCRTLPAASASASAALTAKRTGATARVHGAASRARRSSARPRCAARRRGCAAIASEDCSAARRRRGARQRRHDVVRRAVRDDRRRRELGPRVRTRRRSSRSREFARAYVAPPAGGQRARPFGARRVRRRRRRAPRRAPPRRGRRRARDHRLAEQRSSRRARRLGARAARGHRPRDVGGDPLVTQIPQRRWAPRRSSGARTSMVPRSAAALAKLDRDEVSSRNFRAQGMRAHARGRRPLSRRRLSVPWRRPFFDALALQRKERARERRRLPRLPRRDPRAAPPRTRPTSRASGASRRTRSSRWATRCTRSVLPALERVVAGGTPRPWYLGPSLFD